MTCAERNDDGESQQMVSFLAEERAQFNVKPLHRKSKANCQFVKLPPNLHVAYKIQHRCYVDRMVFGQTKINLRRQDILKICEEAGLEPSLNMYFMPKKPTQVMDVKNCVLVDRIQRNFLLTLWRLKGSEPEYLEYLASVGKI